jgi:hypothetical protein
VIAAGGRPCLHCGRESLTDCCSRCEQIEQASRVEPSTRDVPEWNVPSGTSRVESTSQVDAPSKPSTRDSSTWDGAVLSGADLAAWDENAAVNRFVDRLAAGGAPDKPLGYRYAAAISGEERFLGKPELGNWTRRLLIEGGFVGRPPVALAGLPDGAGAATRELWPAIELLVHARVLGGTPASEPLPLSRRFLQRWARMTEARVRAAMEELESLGYVQREREEALANGRRLILWSVRRAA